MCASRQPVFWGGKGGEGHLFDMREKANLPSRPRKGETHEKLKKKGKLLRQKKKRKTSRPMFWTPKRKRGGAPDENKEGTTRGRWSGNRRRYLLVLKKKPPPPEGKTPSLLGSVLLPKTRERDVNLSLPKEGSNKVRTRPVREKRKFTLRGGDKRGRTYLHPAGGEALVRDLQGLGEKVHYDIPPREGEKKKDNPNESQTGEKGRVSHFPPTSD